MRQPYETIFGPLRNHWVFKRHLHGEVPDWDGLMADPDLDSLSSGEVTLLWIGLAIWNGDRTARIADLAGLDRTTRLRVLAGLAQPNVLL
jgi:hypothetical protein